MSCHGQISNLCNFDSLLTLRLDNNIIDKSLGSHEAPLAPQGMVEGGLPLRIANLGHLKQLTWLDLSFNNIRSSQ